MMFDQVVDHVSDDSYFARCFQEQSFGPKPDGVDDTFEFIGLNEATQVAKTETVPRYGFVAKTRGVLGIGMANWLGYLTTDPRRTPTRSRSTGGALGATGRVRVWEAIVESCG